MLHSRFATNANEDVEMENVFFPKSVDMEGDGYEEFQNELYEFMNVIDDGDNPLYPCCQIHMKFPTLVRLYNLKAKHGMTDSCFTHLLIKIRSLLPDGNQIPLYVYEAKKTMRALGMNYKKIHAFPNDCILH